MPGFGDREGVRPDGVDGRGESIRVRIANPAMTNKLTPPVPSMKGRAGTMKKEEGFARLKILFKRYLDFPAWMDISGSVADPIEDEQPTICAGQGGRQQMEVIFGKDQVFFPIELLVEYVPGTGLEVIVGKKGDHVDSVFTLAW